MTGRRIPRRAWIVLFFIAQDSGAGLASGKPRMSGRSENLSGLRLPVGSHMTAVFIIAIISVSHNQDLLSKHEQNTLKLQFRPNVIYLKDNRGDERANIY